MSNLIKPVIERIDYLRQVTDVAVYDKFIHVFVATVDARATIVIITALCGLAENDYGYISNNGRDFIVFTFFPKAYKGN